MRAIKINPHDRTITEVTLPDDTAKTSRQVLQALYHEIGNGCDLIELVHCGKPTLSHNVDLVIDEEGLLKDNAFFFFRGYPHMGVGDYAMAGTALVIGQARGEYMKGLPEEVTLDMVTSWVRWASNGRGRA
jgi:hypothetical protein